MLQRSTCLFRPFSPQRLQRYFSNLPKDPPPNATHYDILQLPKNASRQDIKEKYYRLCKLLHPDVANYVETDRAKALFIRIKESYEVLSNDEKRRSYDRTIRNHANSNAYATFYNTSSTHSQQTSSNSSSTSFHRHNSPHTRKYGDNIQFNFKEHFERHYGREFREHLRRKPVGETNSWQSIRSSPSKHRAITTVLIMTGFVSYYYQRC